MKEQVKNCWFCGSKCKTFVSICKTCKYERVDKKRKEKNGDQSSPWRESITVTLFTWSCCVKGHHSEACIYTQTQTHTQTETYTHTCVCVFICLCVVVCVCVYIYINIPQICIDTRT